MLASSQVNWSVLVRRLTPDANETMNRRAIAAFLLGLPAGVGACNAVLSNGPVSLWDPDASADGGGVTPDAGGPDATLPGIDSGLATDSGASDVADGGVVGDSARDAEPSCG